MPRPLPRAVLGACALTALASSAHADAPRGIYCSCPPTNGVSHSVLLDVAALDFVDGILLRIAWSDLEVARDVYDWSLLDAELARADDVDVEIALAVVVGPGTPPWLLALGVPTFDYEQQGEPRSIVLPWDATFLEEWTEFVADLGARYDGHPRITLVHATHSTHNGFEMQLPGQLEAWEALGYTVPAHVASWTTVLDAFDSAFPQTPIDVETHPVLGSDTVAQEVMAYGAATIGARFGNFAAWWTWHNAFDVYPGMFTLLSDAACATFGAVQVARSETVHGRDIFGNDGLEGTLRLALDAGVQYAEVWNADLLNPALQPMLADLAPRFRTPRPGDLDHDGEVNFADVLVVLSAWGPCEETPPCVADADCSGAVEFGDLLEVLAGWGG